MIKLSAAALLAAALLPCRAGAACSDDAARQTPGTWESKFQRDIESSSEIPAAETPRVLKEMETYADLLKAALGGNPGHKAVWYRSLGGELFRGGPAKYGTIVPLFRFECDGDKLGHEDEYSELASVYVNSTWEMSGPAPATLINGKKYYVFGSPIGTIRGFPAYQTDYEGMAHVAKWVVLVTRPGKRHAFHLATRKEVLDSMRAQAEKETAEMLPKMNDLGRANAKKQLAKTLARLDAVRARYSPAQLEETAQSHPSAINLAWSDFDFKKTHEEACGTGVCGDGWGRPFALPVRPYYDLSGSRAKPQFFAVTFQWAQGGAKEMDPRIAKLREDFFARFDFDKLVALLGTEKEAK